MKLRLFYAINFPDEVKHNFSLISNELKSFNEPIKFEPIEKFHLTLLFLGNVEENLMNELINQTRTISQNFTKTNLVFDKVGVFKDFKNPRVIWIGAKENESLRNLSYQLKELAQILKIHLDEKPFSPHITLGRVKGLLSKDFIEFLKSFKMVSFESPVFSFELMESQLEKTGSKYFIKEKFLLK